MKNLRPYSWRKEMPEELAEPILAALKFYPELQTRKIIFKYTRRAGTSIMKAQPDIMSVIRLSDDRSYIIYMNRELRLGDRRMALTALPADVITGWIGHELGHVMDYEARSKWGLIAFGIGYLFSGRFVKNAERRADEIAVKHGLGDYILKTKDFILNKAGLSEKYKRKIMRFYLSPEQIMEIIQGEKDLKAQIS